MFQFPSIVIQNLHIHAAVVPDTLATKVEFETFKGQVMSLISDAIADLKATVDTETVEINAKYDALTKKVADLQAIVDSGLATPEDFKALSDLKLQIQGLAPTPVVPPVEPPVVPPVEPPVIPPVEPPVEPPVVPAAP